MALDHFRLPFKPHPTPDAVIRAPAVRFTLLTSRLIRIEYSTEEIFEDRPSQAVWYREHPLPQFEVTRQDDQLEIATEHLVLSYDTHARALTPNSLSVSVKQTGATWRYGDPPSRSRNLLGTTRTLDMTNGFAELEPGLVARNGWAVVDDSHSLMFDLNGWLTQRADLNAKDLYFWGYGHDYLGCIQDFQQIAGRTPLVPRWALGNWWSRYWAYSEQELRDLIEGFQQRDIPLSVCIIDMDWHITETGNTSLGWTGYSWNKTLFSDPQRLLDWLHGKGLKTALNLHPADGVHPHEQQYAEMATAMGIDPASNVPIPFDIADPSFAEVYFKVLHHPHEADGVDFWWIDWQQGTKTQMPGLDPLAWLNHLHFYDARREGNKRPMIFSRWGGLGSHRYPVGFSGDTVVSWESLAFQPFFTATASNVAYGWWSHDIGGHMWGVEEPELYARWVQYGVFSPILRLHSTNHPYSERRPWGWDPATEKVAGDALRLRHQLIPYIYSMAWRNVQKGIPLVTPLYYAAPAIDDAYNCPQAYWFGSELIAAPFTTPMVADLALSRQRVWLPPGEWYNFFTGEAVPDGWYTVYGDLSATPLFARAGAIIPIATAAGWGGIENPDALTLHLFAGADRDFALYEDDGGTTAYQRNGYAETPFAQRRQNQQLIISLGPSSGELRFIPAKRDYHLIIHGLDAPESVAVTVDGRPLRPVDVRYDRNRLHVQLKAVAPDRAVIITIEGSQSTQHAPRREQALDNLLRLMRADSRVKTQIHADLPLLLTGEQTLDHYSLSDEQRSALRRLLEGRAGIMVNIAPLT